jgi:Leucine-rich repeat (LRR) protein
LTKIPDEIKILTNLKSLNLSFNDIENIPDWLSDLDSLIELDMQLKNKLKKKFKGIPLYL